MRYKLVALDLDGTLLNSNGQLSKRHIQAVKKAQQAGIRVVIATGRYYMQTERIVKELDFNGILVSNDGAVTIKNKTKEIIHEHSACSGKRLAMCMQLGSIEDGTGV